MEMKKKSNRQIEDLKEALAGWMLTAAMNGAYITDEMEEWAKAQLIGKMRTPAQVTWEIIERHPVNP